MVSGFKYPAFGGGNRVSNALFSPVKTQINEDPFYYAGCYFAAEPVSSEENI